MSYVFKLLLKFGLNEKDIYIDKFPVQIAEASKMYTELDKDKKSFTLIPCWNILKEEDKWKAKMIELAELEKQASKKERDELWRRYIVLGAVLEAGVAAPRHAVARRQLAGALALEEDDGLGERVGVVERRGEARREEQQVERGEDARAAGGGLWRHGSLDRRLGPPSGLVG